MSIAQLELDQITRNSNQAVLDRIKTRFIAKLYASPAYLDAVDVSDVVAPANSNLVGLAVRQLAQQGRIVRTGSFRRSTKNESRARTVFEWKLSAGV